VVKGGRSEFYKSRDGADNSVDGEDQEESDDEEEDGEEDEEDEDMDEDEKDEDVEMDETPKAHDPNDLSAFKMDEYDEESTGVGESPHPTQIGADNSHGRIRKRQRSIILQGQQRGPVHYSQRGKQPNKNPLITERR
jgi:hypothetical protein